MMVGPLKDPHLKRQDFDKILNDLEEPICPYCKRIFSSRGNLRRHMEIHIMSDRKRFQCDICLKKYKRKDYLKEHKMTVHSPNNKWKYMQVPHEELYKGITLIKPYKKKVDKISASFPAIMGNCSPN
ncbi:hypothetical protein AVEN_202149-1 [Araneus ventricosus]|uniref:C2H2-type domain-containing protein n=1 Tax=Araneus ventricosus TaxID=182803 RepID=A0A4Y2E2K0_ARAVE|nr:hypothetical protein AVEN_202149-1 [Araneus ventricosus]